MAPRLRCDGGMRKQNICSNRNIDNQRVLLVTAVTVSSNAGVTTMVDSENIVDVNASEAPQQLESSAEKPTTMRNYPLLIWLPLLLLAALAAAYYIYIQVTSSIATDGLFAWINSLLDSCRRYLYVSPTAHVCIT